MPNVLPVTAATGPSFFKAALNETVEQKRFREEKILLGLARDVDYVAELLFRSVFFAAESRLDVADEVWNGWPLKASAIDPIAFRIIDGKIEDENAQPIADRLLLRIGIFKGDAWQPVILRLERRGSELYSQAARLHEPPLQKQLASMAKNFLPWTEVLGATTLRKMILNRR